MKKKEKSDIVSEFIVPSNRPFRLKNYDTESCRYPELLARVSDKKVAEEILRANIQRLSEAQELLYATKSKGILIILQGMDAAGKDGTIKHVMSGLNPQGCAVHSFKQPSPNELLHSFIWRYVPALPARGEISIFNRSYYEDVLVVRVHSPDLGKGVWEQRYDDINYMERHLSNNNIIVLKFFLHISKKEQKRRLLERLIEKQKLWKFSQSDLIERQFWDDYVVAYEDALSATSTKTAPWYIIPADNKWAMHALIADVIVHHIHDLKLNYPKPDPNVVKRVDQLKKKLQKE